MIGLLFNPISINSITEIALAFTVALICGLIIALVYRLGTDRPSKYMMIAILIMPAIVETVLMLVNGSIGAGVAVAGAFTLVRFRSIPGTSRDICMLFFTTAAGIAIGMGYLGYAALFTILLSVVIIIAEKIIPAEHTKNSRLIRVNLPGDIDYNGLFDALFKEYATHFTLENVSSVYMGTVFILEYIVTLKDPAKEKEMLDKIRELNGNLPVSCGRLPVSNNEL